MMKGTNVALGTALLMSTRARRSQKELDDAGDDTRQVRLVACRLIGFLNGLAEGIRTGESLLELDSTPPAELPQA